MTLGEAIFTYLGSATSITDTGNTTEATTRAAARTAAFALTSTRVYPMFIPQGAVLPAIEYERDSANTIGSNVGRSGIIDTTYEIKCVSTTHTGAKTLVDYVRSAINFFKGLISTVSVRGIFVEDDDDDIEIAVGADQQRRYIGRVRARFVYAE